LATDALVKPLGHVVLDEFLDQVAQMACCPEIRRRGSCGLPVIEVEKAAEARTAGDLAICPLSFVGFVGPTFPISWPGLDNDLIAGSHQDAAGTGAVVCRERLGGLLNFYHREAA